MTKLIILGCGSSLGSPWITNYWGKCDKKNSRNISNLKSIRAIYGVSILG